jgi:hypothetical protein
MLTAEPVMKGPRIIVAQGTTVEAVIGNLDGSYGQVAEVYGVGLGSFYAHNYLLYTTVGGLVIEAGAGAVTLDDSGITLTGDIIMADDSWIGYPSGPLITFDNTDEQVEITGLLSVSGRLLVDGDYKATRGGAVYTGYLFVPLQTYATSTNWDGDTYTDADGRIIDLSSEFGLPAGIKAVAVIMTLVCSATGKFARLGSSGTYTTAVNQYTQVANSAICVAGVVPCDDNGDIYFYTSAVSGAPMAVYITIRGYWI